MGDTLLKAGSFAAAGKTDIELKQALDGALVELDWRQVMVARGKGWSASVGSLSAPITGGGNGTAVAGDEPEWVIDVPAGQCLVPLRFAVQCQTPLIAADSNESEICILVNRSAISGAAAGNGTVETPINMRTDNVGGCPVEVVSAVVTALSAAPTANLELIHAVRIGDVQGTVANALWGELEAEYAPKTPPFIIGPATIAGYWGGTVATTGFAELDFIVFSSGKVTSLE